MTNDANRTLIVLVAAAMIVVMALLIFITWSADTDAIDKIGDLAEYLDDHNDSAGKLIITLAALIVVVLSLLIIVVELAPEDEQRELRVKQAGATTIVPAAALRARIEEALVALPEVTVAKAKVNTREKGIATALDLTIVPEANIAAVTEEAARVVTDTIQSDLGLPLAGVPSIRVAYGGPKTQPAASSVRQPPTEAPEAPADPQSLVIASSEPVADGAAGTQEPESKPASPTWTQNPPSGSGTEDAPPDPGDVSRDPWRQP